VRIFGIDPGSVRTGYGCVETDGARHRLVSCGAIASPTRTTLPHRLHYIHNSLRDLILAADPHCVVIENLFHARNVRSALTLGHARGVAILAAVQAGLPVVEYTPAEVKLAVVGYGRAEKPQVQRMVMLLLGLDTAPSSFDASDALAAAICHAHLAGGYAATAARVSAGIEGSPSTAQEAPAARARSQARSWRDVKPSDLPRRQAP
jgi:crossover junction endodeoxyribonuclease RuvC